MKKRIKNVSGGSLLINGTLVANNGTVDLTFAQADKLATTLFPATLQYVTDVPTELYVGTGTITTDDIAALAVTEDKIGALAVTEGKIGALAVTEGKLGALAVTEGKIGAGAVTKVKLNADVNIAEYAGSKAVGIIRIASNVADTETVTIGADVYEFDSDADPGTITEGRIRVSVVADLTPATATDALVAAINASGTEAITAIDVSANEILLCGSEVGIDTTAIATTMGGVNNAVDTAAMRVGVASGAKNLVYVNRVPNAAEVALDHLHIPVDFVPTFVMIQVVTTATGIPVAWNGGYSITGGANPYVTINNAGDIDWADSDTVKVLIGE